jgi:hypothetical protein
MFEAIKELLEKFGGEAAEVTNDGVYERTTVSFPSSPCRESFLAALGDSVTWERRGEAGATLEKLMPFTGLSW